MSAWFLQRADRMAWTLAAGAIIVPLVVFAQSGGSAYPTRTVRLVVAYAAGGSNDMVARSLA